MSLEEEFQQLKAGVGYLEDRQRIIDCIPRECRARVRQDVEQINSCWWPAGQDEHGPIIERPIVARPATEGVRWQGCKCSNSSGRGQ